MLHPFQSHIPTCHYQKWVYKAIAMSRGKKMIHFNKLIMVIVTSILLNFFCGKTLVLAIYQGHNCHFKMLAIFNNLKNSGGVGRKWIFEYPNRINSQKKEYPKRIILSIKKKNFIPCVPCISPWHARLGPHVPSRNMDLMTWQY